MKKRYKLLEKTAHIYILYWETEGVLFGPEWKIIAKFTKCDSNLERCKSVIRLMNECDRHTEV